MGRFKFKLLFVCALVVLMSAAPVALGDWDPGDGHKMHYPQLPKPGGWDVAFNFGRLADDWQCSQTGPVSDIHFWVSWHWDDVGPINGFGVRIWSDNPSGSNGYSEPNELLWERDFYAGEFTVRDMPPDLQGWFDPLSGLISPDDHSMWQQINIEDISDPFIHQQEGKIYWLEIDMWGAVDCGWKESGSPQFRDDAVFWDSPDWIELRDPMTEESLDLAFVITGKEEEVVKWEQPPCLYDPCMCMDVDATDDDWMWYAPQALADDFPCTTTGLITDIHIWGSWLWDEPPYEDPNHVWFTLCIYSNDPCGPMGYSQPAELLWMKEFHEGEFDVEIFAEGPEAYYIPCIEDYFPDSDWTCWLYSFYIDPCEAFVQEERNIYWLALQAHIYDPDPVMEWRFGWKNSSEQWNDDAVWAVGWLPDDLGPWEELRHPMTGESVDLAFKITTLKEEVPPKPAVPHLKWSQPPIEIDPTVQMTPPSATYIGPISPSMDGLDFNASDVLYGLKQWDGIGYELYTINQATGVTTLVGPLGVPNWSSVAGLTFASDGTLYTVIRGDLYTLNPATGAATLVGPTGLVVSGLAAVADPPGPDLLYGINWTGGTLFSIDPTTGAGTLIGMTDPNAVPFGLSDRGTAIYMYDWSINSIVQLDPATGQTLQTINIGATGVTGEGALAFRSDGIGFLTSCKGTAGKLWSFDTKYQGPTYCGWDEVSYREWIEHVEPFWFDCWDCRTQCHGDADCDGDVDNDDLLILQAAMGSVWPNPMYNPCADFNRDGAIDAADLLIININMGSNPPADCPERPQTWQMVADDYRCLGSIPVTSVHWWGSHLWWQEPDIMPPDLPIAWRIGFWSNVSATQRCDFLYGAATGQPMGNAPSSLYKIDPFTGVATLIGPIGFNGVTGLSFAPDGTLYGTCNNPTTDSALLITIDTTTGAGTLVGPINTTGTGQRRVPDISFRSNGVLYGYGDGPDQLITIDTATGQGTAVGATGYWGGGNGLDFAPGGTLYATPFDNQSLVIINPATGAGSDVAGTVGNVPDRINALEFCESTGVLYGSWNDSASGNRFLVTIDLTTGLPTVIGQTVQGLDAITFNTFSHPDELLWQIEIPEDRVDVKEVGIDEYPDFSYDVCYQYYVDLEPNEIFWQGRFLRQTEDDIFWLSIAAVYEPDVWPDYPWGWKTRPWSWMDDAVRFWIDEEPEPGMVLDPGRNMIEPIEEPYFGESFDLAFELDTDPCWIKHEQPFTGIRDWSHYEDEKSMAIEVTTVETVTKYIQHPDTSPNGIDVDATTVDDGIWSAQILADDFNCTTTEPITDIHIWGSWYHDYPFPEDVDFCLSIWSDRPVGPGGWSEPNEWLWGWCFMPGEFDVSIEAPDLEEGYYVPCADPPYYEAGADTICYKYDFYIDPFDAFMQKGSPDEPVVYWLVVEAYPWLPPVGGDEPLQEPIRFGWKTSTDHWNDDAVWTDTWGDWWNELRYPAGHPYEGHSIDLAFEITTEEKETEFHIDRLVADDWPCDNNDPVTAAVWWGSYIGYNYAACDITGPWMPLPVKPKYFWLTIWDDVPAGADLPYSHPNDIIWEYKAYDYDEVLVGYDKYPLDPTGQEGREPVFRYSVRLPDPNWFCQERPNDVYWFSVVAVYDGNNYDWGWTNHKHVYNDDAVAGYLDASGEWTWEELYDQNGDSEDMSFVLFTHPNPYYNCPDYNNDGIVNFIDYAYFADDWRWSGPLGGYNNSDLNCDGLVDLYDLAIFVQHWLESCQPPCP